ncbi:MAG: bifunctional serine/threonine-protein kinase/formylglycine-generating enzyme family protein [Sodaliphilus sp.]|nr:bifunctional serine/threonine-protein kinase/formylglycine-generating enzyme family protein [Sodaliphilus sp.]
MDALQPDSTLQGGKYRIIEKLGQGGFGITYLAENTMLEGKVAIKEFFFKEYCERDDATCHVTIPTTGNREIVERFKQKFIKEAKTTFKLNHPNIVRILDVFEENGTAYYVMDYIEGESLGDMVKRRGAIPEAEALGYVKDAASALEYVHSKNINHLDIKPSNLMRRKEDGRIIVIDFGVVKQYATVISEGCTPACISHGYSPAEQYRKNGVQAFSPQSDVYALAATLFKLLTGNTPPNAIKIRDEGLPVAKLQEKYISLPVISAIAMAMKGRHERIQSMVEFIGNLNSDDTTLNSNPAEAERKRKEVGEKTTKTFKVGSVSFDMVWVEGGTFRMGATSEQGSGAFDCEKPVHSVTLSGYYIGKTEVTQALWKAVMVSNPSKFIGDNLPVESVSWDDCQEFIRKLNSLTGQNFRLPTEAEWEFACRGGNNSRGYIFSGSNYIDNVAWYDGNYGNSGGKTHPVATKLPNELGIYDMTGNVWEWCSDWYGTKYSSGAQTNPKGPYDGSYRVSRGGSWIDYAGSCRSSFRGRDSPGDRNKYLGLRLSL